MSCECGQSAVYKNECRNCYEVRTSREIRLDFQRETGIPTSMPSRFRKTIDNNKAKKRKKW